MSKEEAIKQVMEDFDFEKAAEIMRLLNWTWHDEKETPTVDAIKKVALRILNDAWDGKTGYCSTGGYTAQKHGSALELTFEAISSIVDFDIL